MRILVTDASYKHSLGIVRELGSEGHAIVTCSEHSAALARYSRFVEKHVTIPSHNPDEEFKLLSQSIRQNKIELLIPVGYRSCLLAADHREEIAEQCKVVIADAAKIRRAADKIEMAKLAKSLGIRTPATLAPNSIEEALEWYKNRGGEYVIKSRYEGSARQVSYASTFDDFENQYRDIAGRSESRDDGLPIIQERLRGDGYGFFALYVDGTMNSYFMHHRIREYPIEGGPSTCAESFRDDELFAKGKTLLDSLKWHGVAMVEFKRDRPDGEYVLLEVNPKFWGSLDLALQCGVSFPRMLVDLAEGSVRSWSHEYPVGLRYHWPLSGDLRGLFRRPGRFVQAVFDLLRPGVKSNLWWSDAIPNIMELIQAMTPGFLKRLLRGRQ